MGESVERKKLLIIGQPAYGDSIILKSLLKNVQNNEWEIDILTKGKFRDLFLGSGSASNIICCDFPIWYNKRFSIVDAIQGWGELRKKEYDVVLDYIGDFRNRYIGYFCGAKKFVTVEREEGHPFNNLIRRGLGFLADEKIVIPADIVNIYDQIKFVFERVGLRFKDCDKTAKQFNKNIVGVHPFASQECRLWERDKWRSLIEKLDDGYRKIYVFGAPHERNILEKQLGNLVSENVEIFTGSLIQFMEKLKELDLLIGLDSFSVHAAYAAGVPNIMICGANDYRMWQTPLTKVVAPKEDCCPYWPCYNKPKCNGEYGCIDSISVDDVLITAREMKKVYRICGI